MAMEVTATQQIIAVEDTAKKLGSDAPAGANPSMNEDLKKVWEELEVEVQKLAEFTDGSQEYNKNIGKHNVMDNLERIQRKSKKKEDSRWAAVQKAFSRTLEVIGRAGGMVADAVSQVFAPATQCYNALNFVISAYKGYLGAFETLKKLFDESFEFLKRLPHYNKGNMPDNLCQIVSKFLRTFVQICARALELRRSRWAKFAKFMSIAFLGEGDFSDYKEHLKYYTHLESLAVGAVNFERIANTEEGVKNLNDLANRNRAEKEDNDDLVTALAFDQGNETWDSHNQKPIETWTRINDTIHYRKVEGTGECLFKGDKFKAWENPEGGDPILALVGDKASGKSYLISAVISHLRTKGASKEGTPRRLVAFHYIDNKKRNAEYHSLGKSIIWQFTASDPSYKQSVAATCRHKHIDTNKILLELLLEKDDMEKIDAVFYIVINKLGSRDHNVDKALVKFLQRVSKSKSKNVRVLFSTTEGTMKNLERQEISCTTIQISKHNDSDRRKYIADRMDTMSGLKNSGNDKVAEIRKTVQNMLCEKIKGDYDLLNKALEDLRPLETEEDIINNLSRAGSRNMAQHIHDDIANLNATRHRKELEDINEIIMWLTFGKGPKSPELISAVLQVKNGTTPLTSLEERLKDKFILFEINEDGYVDFTSENIRNEIPERRDLAKNREENSQTVKKNEVDIVKHFLKTVCPSDLLDRLALDKYFEQKMHSREEQICREDQPTAHFLIAKRCVDVLANPSYARLSALRQYAFYYLVTHMRKTERRSIDSVSLAEFGSSLATLLYDPDTIDNVLEVNSSNPTHVYLPAFLLNVNDRKEIFEWLKDPRIAAKINGEASTSPKPTHW